MPWPTEGRSTQLRSAEEPRCALVLCPLRADTPTPRPVPHQSCHRSTAPASPCGPRRADRNCLSPRLHALSPRQGDATRAGRAPSLNCQSVWAPGLILQHRDGWQRDFRLVLAISLGHSGKRRWPTIARPSCLKVTRRFSMLIHLLAPAKWQMRRDLTVPFGQG